jgi:hypothetical protein
MMIASIMGIWKTAANPAWKPDLQPKIGPAFHERVRCRGTKGSRRASNGARCGSAGIRHRRRRIFSDTMASNKCWSLMVGSRSLSRRGRTFAPADDRHLREITTRHFPTGYTILHADGGWFDPVRRKFMREESRQVLICAAGLGAVRRWAQELGAALQQKELLVIELGRAIRWRVKARTD